MIGAARPVRQIGGLQLSKSERLLHALDECRHQSTVVEPLRRLVANELRIESRRGPQHHDTARLIDLVLDIRVEITTVRDAPIPEYGPVIRRECVRQERGTRRILTGIAEEDVCHERHSRVRRAYVDLFFTGTGTPAIFTPTENSVLRVVKKSVFQSSPPNAMFVVAGWPCTMRPSFLPFGST